MAANALLDRAPPLFGREEVRERILRGLRAASAKEGGVLVLEGEEGIGKTTVLRTAAAEARRLGFRILEARGVPSDSPEPFGVVRRLMRSVSASSAGLATADVGRRPLGGLALFLVPTWEHGDSEGHETGASVEAPAGEGDPLLDALASPTVRPEEGTSRVRDEISSFLVAMSEKAPLYLSIDDVEFADEQSIDLLLEIARGPLPHPVFVLVAKGDSKDRSASCSPAVDTLTADARVPRLRIRPMSPGELWEYVHWLLDGREVPPEIVQRWFAQTQGNPRFLERIARKSALSAKPGGVSVADEGEDALRLQVWSLSADDRRILLHAAVLGREFDFAALHAALAHEDRLALAEALERLTRAGLLREREEEVFAFAREAVRAEVYRGLTESLRRVLHRKAARAIEARTQGETTAVYELARQYYLAQDDAKSVEFNQRAAERSVAAFAYGDAAMHYDRALESLRRSGAQDPAREIRLLVEFGRVLGEPLGDVDRAKAVLEEAVGLARADPGLKRELALALLFLARHTVNRGLNEQGRALAEEALALFEREGNRRGALVAYRTLGLAHIWLSDFVSAEAHLLRALGLAEAEGDPAQQGVVLVELANALITPGPARGEEALAYYDRAAALLTPTGDSAALARLRMNQAWILEDSGRGDEATHAIALACDLAERSGSRYWRGWCTMVEALVRTNHGRLTEAEESLARAQTFLAPLGDAIADQQLAWIAGMLAEKRGRWAEARERYDHALAEARRLGVRADVALMLFRHAHLAFAEGHSERARELLRQALDAEVESVHSEVRTEVEELRRALGL